MTKRHVKPTSAQLAARTYRHVLRLESRMEDYIATGEAINAIQSGQAMLALRIESLRVLADHCARLLKEKETLQRQMELMKDSTAMRNVWRHNADTIGIPTFYTDGTVARAPDFQAARHGACAFASSHRAGIRCGVCGEIDGIYYAETP